MRKKLCKRHQTIFKQLCYVVDCAKGNIIGKRNLDYPCITFLNDVILVDGFTANVISINQLFYQDLCVKFDNMEWIIRDEQQ